MVSLVQIMNGAIVDDLVLNPCRRLRPERTRRVVEQALGFREPALIAEIERKVECDIRTPRRVAAEQSILNRNRLRLVLSRQRE